LFYIQDFAQNLSHFRKKVIFITSDSLKIDTLSIVPQSEKLIINHKTIPYSDYHIDYMNAILFLDNQYKGNFLQISYISFPFSFALPYFHKPYNIIENKVNVVSNPFNYEYNVEKSEDIFYLNGINKSGSISRGVGFGNNQNLSVNSSLNLQLSGKISNNVSILASISDDNVPIQADGNTQQLQDFDKVYIQLFSDQWKLTAGDFYLQKPESYFMNFNKKLQGGSFTIKLNDNHNTTITPTISAAVSKGKFARNKINGIEGNQGPYRLKGADNESFIVVLSGTEKIYIDGQLMERGNESVEFQYSDKNYARSLAHFGNTIENKKWKINLNVYSEQDSKNQPLQQTLNDSDKIILASVGDSLQNAIKPNVTFVNFSDNLVLYHKIDSLGYTPVYVYSTNPDSARYQLGFTYLGPNKGNYKQIQSTANGKVYQWQIPINGVPQGEYEPIVLLIAPKIKQMVALGGKVDINKNSYLQWEGAVSNNNINTFSNKNKSDDIGYAFKMDYKNKTNLSADKNPIQFLYENGYEFVERYFSPIERFRNVEFDRDWNLSNLTLNSDQHILKGLVGLQKSKKTHLIYSFNFLDNIKEYEGFNNTLNGFFQHKGFVVEGTGSILNTKGLNKTQYIKHKGLISKNIKWITIGASEESEENQFFNQNSDTLLLNSFKFNSWTAFIHNADTTFNKFVLSYKQRQDNSAFIKKFKGSTMAQDISANIELLKSKNHKFRSKFTYRKLSILDTTLTINKPEENILARLEYVSNLLKGFISSNTYYEVGSGLEIKKEFTYVQVQDGQGTHTYIGDLNNNNVKDLNEFEVAAFQDQANYIKIFTPTNDFIRTYTNQFNQGLF